MVTGSMCEPLRLIKTSAKAVAAAATTKRVAANVTGGRSARPILITSSRHSDSVSQPATEGAS